MGNKALAMDGKKGKKDVFVFLNKK